MRTFAIAVLLSVAGVCMGQQSKKCPPGQHATAAHVTFSTQALVDHSKDWVECAPDLSPQPAPLKCGKYEHETLDCRENDHRVAASNASFVCTPVRLCAPDLHTVTEKEWQELMERLKKLEGRGK